MNFFSRLLGLLTRSGRDDDLLLQGVEHAKAKRPEKAIETYTALLASNTSPAVRGRALYNRSLAYSSLNNDEKALADLKEALNIPNLPANVQTAVRERLTRLKHRQE